MDLQGIFSDVRAWFLAGLAGLVASLQARGMVANASASGLAGFGAFMGRAVTTVFCARMLAEECSATTVRDVPSSRDTTVCVDAVVELLTFVTLADAKMTAGSRLVTGLPTNEVLWAHRARHNGRVPTMQELLVDLNLAPYLHERVELVAVIRNQSMYCEGAENHAIPMNLGLYVPAGKLHICNRKATVTASLRAELAAGVFSWTKARAVAHANHRRVRPIGVTLRWAGMAAAETRATCMKTATIGREVFQVARSFRDAGFQISMTRTDDWETLADGVLPIQLIND